MSNKEDTTREATNCKLYDLYVKIIDNAGNPTLQEKVLNQDLPKLNAAIMQCDDLRVDPQKLASNIVDYFRNLPLQALPTPVRKLSEFENDLQYSPPRKRKKAKRAPYKGTSNPLSPLNPPKPFRPPGPYPGFRCPPPGWIPPKPFRPPGPYPGFRHPPPGWIPPKPSRPFFARSPYQRLADPGFSYFQKPAGTPHIPRRPKGGTKSQETKSQE